MKTALGILLLSLSLSGFAQELLTDDIPRPFYEVQKDSQNELLPVTDGRAALQIRLDMIARAKKSIEVEYFIYDVDLAGKIVTKELIKAAERGVKVRMLVDKSKPIFEFDEYYVSALKPYGIEVRFYNKAPIARISTVQFRNHRKLITVDDQEAITGGRNIGDDYFDLSDKFNFNDTDVYIKGPIAKTMRESFDKYFEHKISERPNLEKAVDKKKLDEVKTFLSDTEEESEMRKSLATHGEKFLAENKLYACPETTYVTDAPGATFFKRIGFNFDENYKFVRKALFDKLSRVDQKVLFSSPYLIANSHANKLMKSLLKRNVEITVYTNSLASTDAVYVAANLYYDVFKWTNKGINIYLHDGLFTNGNPDLEDKIKNARWGTHTKAQVYESTHGSEAMIGTYNIDNRSNFYNSEMAVFCKGNEEYSQLVKNGIMEMAAKGIKINKDGSATDREGTVKSVFGSTEKDLKLMRFILLPSWLLKFLL